MWEGRTCVVACGLTGSKTVFPTTYHCVLPHQFQVKRTVKFCLRNWLLDGYDAWAATVRRRNAGSGEHVDRNAGSGEHVDRKQKRLGVELLSVQIHDCNLEMLLEAKFTLEEARKA
jgi:hypothetical protein